MTVLSPVTIGLIWQRNGGSPAHTVVAVAVALAESGGDDHAVSPSADFGLWQINESNFANLHIDSVAAMNPDVSARCAIAMSGNGTNWAAWCTTSTDPGDCGHGYRPLPLPGSAAYDQMSVAAAALGSLAGPTAHATVTHDGVDAVTDAWRSVQSFHHDYAGQVAKRLTDHAAKMRGLVK